MKTTRTLNTVLLALLAALFTGTTSAGTCKGVKFNFENSLDAKIKIEKVLVKGDGKQWAHNINNKVVFAGESYTTQKLRFKKLDAGSSGTFEVSYIGFNASNGKWSGKKIHGTKTVRCDDNMTIRFRFN